MTSVCDQCVCAHVHACECVCECVCEREYTMYILTMPILIFHHLTYFPNNIIIIAHNTWGMYCSTFEHVTMVFELNLRWRTASQWWTSVFTIEPLFTSHTLQTGDKVWLPVASLLLAPLGLVSLGCTATCIRPLFHILPLSHSPSLPLSLPLFLPPSPPPSPPTNLMVESLDPVMMTLSSYCRHSTDPV